ncbi:MAG: 30S ribosomal protein S19e [Ferroplasma sp.]
MVNVNEVPADLLLNKLASEFKEKNVEIPDWTHYLKDGIGREKAWEEEDWYYTRLASVMRKISLKNNIGIARMSQEYGSRQDRGTKKYHPVQGSRYIVRNVFHTLESMGYVKKDKTGRSLTPAGQSVLDIAAKNVMKELSEKDKVFEKYL